MRLSEIGCVISALAVKGYRGVFRRCGCLSLSFSSTVVKVSPPSSFPQMHGNLLRSPWFCRCSWQSVKRILVSKQRSQYGLLIPSFHWPAAATPRASRRLAASGRGDGNLGLAIWVRTTPFFADSHHQLSLLFARTLVTPTPRPRSFEETGNHIADKAFRTILNARRLQYPPAIPAVLPVERLLSSLFAPRPNYIRRKIRSC
jgi:hypothetical protein